MQLEWRKPNYWYDRENWYRVRDREPQTVKATLDVGTDIVASSVIVRAGYYWEHMDCPQEDQNRLAIELMAKRLKLTEEECQRIVIQMQQYPTSFSSTSRYVPLHDLYYLVRRQWVRSQPKFEDTDSSLRTFWYADPDPAQVYRVLDKKMKMIGTPDWEEDGSWFNEKGRQQLYRVRKRSRRSRYRVNRHVHADWFVHPADAEVV